MTDRSGGAQLDIDTVFSLLSEYERRYALYHLMGQDRPVPLEELVEQIAVWEQTLAPGSFRECREIRRTLVDTHLPELQGHGIVEYDEQTAIAEVNEGFPLLTAILRRAEQSEPFERSRQ